MSLCALKQPAEEHKKNKYCQLNPCSKPFIEKQFYWSALLLFILKIVLLLLSPLCCFWLCLFVVNVRYTSPPPLF